MLRHVLIASALLAQVLGHAAWKCPTPRVPNPGLKTGPCGGTGNGNIFTGITEVAPGPFTVFWTEPVVHRGSPFRIALTDVSGQDYFENCVLLDHIPHKDNGPSGQEYAATIIIPDVKCDNCALQLLQVMTDKIDRNLGSTATNCTYDPADTDTWADKRCGSNYHSCANIKITGKGTLNSDACKYLSPPDWPFPKVKDAKGLVYSESEADTYDGLFPVNAPDSVKQTTGICVASDTTAAPTTSSTSAPTSSTSAPSSSNPTVAPSASPSSSAAAWIPSFSLFSLSILSCFLL